MHRWASPYEWLEHKSLEWDREQLRAEFLNLAVQHYSDTLQDLYESEMDKDGYFEEIKETVKFSDDGREE